MAKGNDKRRGLKANETRDPNRRRGLPDPRSVVAQTTFQSPKGTRYRVLKTTERDAYDPPAGSDENQTRPD